MKKIYIAGKVSGLPIAEVSMKFGSAQQELETKGFKAVNPLRVVNDWKATWEEAMKKCIRALTECDAVYLLPCYVDSPGAKFEIDIAHKLGIPVCSKIDGFLQFRINQDIEVVIGDPRNIACVRENRSGGEK